MAKNTDLISLFISEICSLLDIRKPKIEYKPQDFFPTSTMLAMYDSKGTVMYLRSSDEATPDLLFAIAHELRHCWQIGNDPGMSEGYHEAQDMTVEEYNLQAAEIDANAFASVVMAEFFGVKPLFHGLPENVKNQIYKKMETYEDGK